MLREFGATDGQPAATWLFLAPFQYIATSTPALAQCGAALIVARRGRPAQATRLLRGGAIAAWLGALLALCGLVCVSVPSAAGDFP